MLKSVLRGLMWLSLGLGLAAGTLWIVGPYEPVQTTLAFDPRAVPDDLDGWLADQEGLVADLDPDHAKSILWATAPGQRTDLAIVYVHGFSATKWEIRPVPDRVAEAVGANLFLMRLSGHGRDGAALAEPRVQDWLTDLAEAMEVGRRLGDRVIVMSTSTGSTLAAILAADPALAAHRDGLAGLVMVSPNFKIAHPASVLLSLPAARHWVPLVAGAQRSFAPLNDRHARHWTTAYPTVAALPVQASIDYARDL
ncbi:MAG: alpha/beta hydrolase, partial [Pseudomonadota bacterium]